MPRKIFISVLILFVTITLYATGHVHAQGKKDVKIWPPPKVPGNMRTLDVGVTITITPDPLISQMPTGMPIPTISVGATIPAKNQTVVLADAKGKLVDFIDKRIVRLEALKSIIATKTDNATVAGNFTAQVDKLISWYQMKKTEVNATVTIAEFRKVAQEIKSQRDMVSNLYGQLRAYLSKNVLENFEQKLLGLNDLIARIEEKLNQLSSSGIDVTEATSKLAEIRDQLGLSLDKVAQLKILYDQATPENTKETIKEIRLQLKEQIKIVRTLIMELRVMLNQLTGDDVISPTGVLLPDPSTTTVPIPTITSVSEPIPTITLGS